jgi:hypothetical protein
MLCKNSEKNICYSPCGISVQNFFKNFFYIFFSKVICVTKSLKCMEKGVCPILRVCPIKIAALGSYCTRHANKKKNKNFEHLQKKEIRAA